MATEKIKKKRQVKKELIFQAALGIFGKYGFKKTTLEDISKKLNMTKSSLYRYVKDKQDLYDQTVSFGLIRWRRTAVKSIQGEPDPLVQLRNYAVTGLTYLDTDTDLKNVILKDPAIFPLNTREDRFSHINQESMEVVKSILKNGVETGRFRSMDIDHTASFLYSVYVMFIIRSQVDPDIVAVDEVLKAGLDTLLFGLVKT